MVRLKEEVRAMRRELGEARGAREEMVSIYIHIYTSVTILMLHKQKYFI